MIVFLYCSYLYRNQKIKTMKFSWKGYWEPTPKGIRKIADSILAGAMLASTFAIMNDYPKLAMWVMVISVVTKMASNFLTDEDSQP